MENKELELALELALKENKDLHYLLGARLHDLIYDIFTEYFRDVPLDYNTYQVNDELISICRLIRECMEGQLSLNVNTIKRECKRIEVRNKVKSQKCTVPNDCE